MRPGRCFYFAMGNGCTDANLCWGGLLKEAAYEIFAIPGAVQPANELLANLENLVGMVDEHVQCIREVMCEATQKLAVASFRRISFWKSLACEFEGAGGVGSAFCRC